MECGGKVFVAPLGKRAIKKLHRCVLTLAGISTHYNTELPAWQQTACNIVFRLRQVVMMMGHSYWNAFLPSSLCNILLVKELNLLLFSKIPWSYFI